jgi:hypothetical protein
MKHQQTIASRPNIWRLLLVSLLLIELGYAIIWERKIMLDFFFQNWLEILDVIYKASGIALVIGLLFAYQQYKKTAEQTKTQVELAKKSAKREALCLAAQQCDHYGRDIMTKSGNLIRNLQNKKCEFLARAKVTIGENQIGLDASGIRPEDNKKILEHYAEITLVLNSIEGFAIYFASDVADDNIGYIECGRSFVKHFEDCFALYCINQRIEIYFKATQALYWRWKKRLLTEELVKHHQELTKQMTITSQKIDPSKLKPNDPVGT